MHAGGAVVIDLSRGAEFTVDHGHAETRLALASAGQKVAAYRDWILANPPAGKRVGLVFRTSTELVLCWLGALAAGLEPCVLHFPTAKLSERYWLDSTNDTIARCGISTVIVTPAVCDLASQLHATVRTLPKALPESDDVVSAVDGAFIQLSSGTTGHKKPIRYDLDTALAHVQRYGEWLGLDASDCIISWLPLYHDMGFVACFLMPLAFGLRTVLIDPMRWTRSPASLYEAITKHRGTTCWMPNFGFEVMSRQPTSGLPSMRRWISCSEPSRLDTLERFCRASRTSHEAVSTCYAMAENVFAISQSEGLTSRLIDGRSVVSCGRPLRGTDVKLVDGEIMVRSASSLATYADGSGHSDADGYYGTGDVGVMLDGEIFVLGRRHDVMITAGQKRLLSDLDHDLNQVTGCAGRGAALPDADPATRGTEAACFLVEREEFWDTAELPTLHRALQEATGLTQLSLHLVPPAFITKTSSGKINRRQTLSDWHACRGGRPTRHLKTSIQEDLRLHFPDLPADAPVGEALDSLASVTLQLLLEEHGCDWDPTRTISEIVREPSTQTTQEAGHSGLSIVFLADWDNLGWIDDAFVGELAKAAGVPVQVDHVCVPPSFVLLNDLIFHDYFMARDAGRDYRAVAQTLRRIRQASLLVVDDMAELWYPGVNGALPALSHRFDRDPRADRLALRWTPYIANHHRLGVRVVDMQAHPAAARNDDLARLSQYLQVPIFRRATTQRYAHVTSGWESRALRDEADVEAAQGDDWASMQRDLIDYLIRHASRLPRSPEPVTTGVRRFGDRNHFCANLANEAAIDFIVSQPHESYVIAGVSASVPLLARRLEAAGKRVRFSRTLNVGAPPVDCVVQTGTWGVPDTDAPVFELMKAGRDRGVPLNVTPAVAARWPGFEEPVASGLLI